MKALLQLQMELKIGKNQYNSFGGYAFRNASDILEAVKPLLVKHNLTLTINDDLVDVAGDAFIKATVTVKGEEGAVSASAFAKHPLNQKGMNDAQISGSTSSYARKYALSALFLIDDSVDADSDMAANRPDPTVNKVAPPKAPSLVGKVSKTVAPPPPPSVKK